MVAFVMAQEMQECKGSHLCGKLRSEDELKKQACWLDNAAAAFFLRISDVRVANAIPKGDHSKKLCKGNKFLINA